MSGKFLEALHVSEEERAKLAKLGASTPLALLAMRKASKAAFDDYFGEDRAEAIATELHSFLTEKERESLKEPAKVAGKLGARIESLPKPKNPQSDS